jgi:Apoptosis regulator proteins, Bcl-2 family
MTSQDSGGESTDLPKQLDNDEDLSHIDSNIHASPHLTDDVNIGQFDPLFTAEIHSKKSVCRDPLVTLDGRLLPASFRAQSVQITDDVVRYVCAGRSDAEPASSKSATIMRSLVDDLLHAKLSSMRQLADRLDVRCPDDVILLNSVATAMFDDDVVTWGRIVTLFAFASYLARYCRERGLIECSEAVGQVLDSIVVDRLGLWILASGGWVSKICAFVCLNDCQKTKKQS